MRLTLGCFAAASVLALASGAALAQQTLLGVAAPMRSTESPELRSLAEAMTNLRATFTGDRLVHEEGDRTWGLRERMFLEGAPGGRFAIKLLEVLGGNAPPTPIEIQKRTKSFDSHAGFLMRYHGFRIADIAAASRSYVYWKITHSRYLDRATNWVAVLSVHPGRSSWLLQLDDATGYPLYSGEYGPTGRLCSEYIIREFQPGAAAQIPNDLVWWKPVAFDVKEFAKPSDAIAAFSTGRAVPFVPRLEDLPPGYELALTRVTTSLLNNQKALSFDFTDGIDHIFVSEQEIVPAPVTPQTAHQIFVYSELSATECMFQHQALQVVTIGNGDRNRIRELARSMYVQVLK